MEVKMTMSNYITFYPSDIDPATRSLSLHKTDWLEWGQKAVRNQRDLEESISKTL